MMAELLEEGHFTSWFLLFGHIVGDLRKLHVVAQGVVKVTTLAYHA